MPVGAFLTRKAYVQKKHYLYLNSDGNPEAIDIETGEVMPMVLTSRDMGKYRIMRHEDGSRTWVPLVDLPKPKAFSVLLADEMCAIILKGDGIQKACDAVGITYREYCQWRKIYPEFADMLDEARKDRAELIFEKLERVAEETDEDEDAVALGRLKADIYKHVSEVADPSRYGKKTQITAKIGVGRIEIETGIRRQGDDGYKEAPLLGDIEARQKQIAEADLNLVPVLAPMHLPKKVDEI